jgi:hypothetical protein
MDVTDEPDLDPDETQPAEPKPQPGQRKKRSDAGKPRGSGRPHSRFARRSAKAAETVRELVRIRMPELDVSELSFVETVDRDADAWGDFLAQVAEWVEPFGVFLDLVFGAALIRVLRVAPSFSAGRRELVERRERVAATRAAAAEEEELREAIEREHDNFDGGMFGQPPLPGYEPPETEAEPVQMTREEWLAGNGGE